MTSDFTTKLLSEQLPQSLLSVELKDNSDLLQFGSHFVALATVSVVYDNTVPTNLIAEVQKHGNITTTGKIIGSSLAGCEQVNR